METLLVLQVLTYDPSFWLESMLLICCLVYLISKIHLKKDVKSKVRMSSNLTMYRGLRPKSEQVLSRFRLINRKLKVGSLISVKEVA